MIYYKMFMLVNFFPQVIFVFLLFLGIVMSANEVETKEVKKLTTTYMLIIVEVIKTHTVVL